MTISFTDDELDDGEPMSREEHEQMILCMLPDEADGLLLQFGKVPDARGFFTAEENQWLWDLAVAHDMVWLREEAAKAEASRAAAQDPV